MLSPQVSSDKIAELNASPPLRIVICGEVSSGKSTVLNALLRARILPDNIGSTRRPVILAAYGDEPRAEIQNIEGQSTTLDTMDDPNLFRDAAQIRIWSNHSHMAGLEIVEVPLTKAEELTEAQIELIRSSDVMIWVTIASQAWRLTEKTIVDQLGDARPDYAILTVSRADKLRNKKDRARLKERLVRETEYYFDDCIFVNAPRKKIADAANLDKAWAETGGLEIASILRSFHDHIHTARVDGADPQPLPETTNVVDFTAHQEAAELAENESLSIKDDSVVPLAVPSSGLAEEASKANSKKPSVEDLDLAALQTVISNLSEAVVVGLCLGGSAQDFKILSGDTELGHNVGGFCRKTLHALTEIFEPEAPAGPVSSFTLSTGNCIILFQDLPDVGLVFIMSSTSDMNQGSAQNILGRLCRALQTGL